jgi:two-component system chemotaxis sensor kinase CheA
VTAELRLGGRPSIALRGTSVPLVDLADVLGAVAPPTGAAPLALIMSASGRQIAVICDRVVGEEEAVVKTLGPLLGGVPGYLGAAVRPDGRIALILDPSFVSSRPSRKRVSSEPSNAARDRQQMLVVDDEFTVRELQRSILEAAGYEVFTARNGREALETLASKSDVELVVTDIEMPEMSGLELLGAIRGREQGRSLPVIVVTSHGSEDDRRRGADAGADAYIVKSDFDQEGLLAAVGRLLPAQ